MRNSKLLLLSTILMLSACASTTPIAVPTPQFKVAPVDQEIKQQEMAALSQMTIASAAWSKWVSDLPQPSTPAAPR